jgi:L-cysteine/cystine lyase
VWYAIAQRYGVRLHFLDIDGDDDQLLLHSLERLLEQQIRLVSISHVSRRSGRRLPARSIAELAHRHNVSVLLDGAQAFGSVPVDTRELGCDFYVLSGHKYILGPQATGAFYLRRERIETLKPSWLGSRSQQWMDLNGGLVLHESARRYEFGTRNMADIAGFGAALAMWESIGWGAVFAAIAEYAAGMRAALAHVPGLLIETPKLPAQGSGIVTFRMPGITGHELYTRLLEHERILVSPFEPGTESVRVSTHVFNTEAERERLVAALSAVGQTHRRGDK